MTDLRDARGVRHSLGLRAAALSKDFQLSWVSDLGAYGTFEGWVDAGKQAADGLLIRVASPAMRRMASPKAV